MNIQIIDLVSKAIKKFSECAITVPNHRYLSWEHCYSKFIEARTSEKYDIDNLSLHLAFYLASWGMYRGSSFLLQRDYKIHQQVVEEILKPDYNILAGINWINQSDMDVKSAYNYLRKLVSNLKDIYASDRKIINVDTNTDISDVLITKVLMGTLGCVPAYDRYFSKAIKSLKVAPGKFNIKTLKSMTKLIDFYKNHKDDLEEIRNNMKIRGITKTIYYPQMKIIDMGFWQIGMALDPKIWKKDHPNVEMPKSDFVFVERRLDDFYRNGHFYYEIYNDHDI